MVVLVVVPLMADLVRFVPAMVPVVVMAARDPDYGGNRQYRN